MIKRFCSLVKTLQTVCTSEDQCVDCPEALMDLGDGDIPVMPGAITADAQDLDDTIDPVVKSPNNNNTANVAESTTTTTTTTVNPVETTTVLLVPRVNKELPTRKASNVIASNDVIDTPNENIKVEEEVKVGASSNDKSSGGGGVDKSVIGIIVAAMVVIVAAVVIKKNWTSIRNRFSSNPRPATDRPNAPNGTAAPEEVPLQEKSPV